MSADLVDELINYGALRTQLIDVASDEDPRLLSYLDLRAASPGWRTPVVVEGAGRPCVHIFDGRTSVSAEDVKRWCWRISLRGDGAWVGVLEPGRLRVYRADVVDDEIQPSEVDEAARGTWVLPKFLSDVSAGQDDIARRRYLTQLLDRSARQAMDLGLFQIDALSFVGRGLFWRFLVDRNLLAGLKPADVCATAETWAQCLDNKARALKTFRWLDETFNGGLLPFEQSTRDFRPELFQTVLGNIAHGATHTGQLRLPTDWNDVNFSYVPVGLLSEVYEAFAHYINPETAQDNSIHYTPAHIVDFVVSQAMEQLPSGGKPRVLDPAAGAGVFLVTAFRKLVAREWSESGKRPPRRRIREILHKQLVGFDIDARALRLAELALYLTALELDPRPKPLNELKFDELRNSVLFDLSGVSHGSLAPVADRFRNSFDLVIGNPPWTAKRDLAAKKAWVKHTRNFVEERLGAEHALAFDLPDTNMDLPFVWRAMEWSKIGGRIALVTHARWLFGISERATQARNELLRAVRVTGLLNGTALRLTKVWPEVDAPWCVLFATNELPDPLERAAFQFVSPALDADIDSKQARVRIDWLDAKTVPTSEAISQPSTLKTRFRGNRLAARALDSMRRCGVPLGKYLEQLKTTIRNGYQLTGDDPKPTPAQMKKMLDTKGAGALPFVLVANSLPKFRHQKLHRARKVANYKAPLLLLRKAIPADMSHARTHLAQVDVAFHESFHGASFANVPNGEDVAAYLQLVLQSSAFPFFEVLTDAQYGVFVDAIYLESALRFPVVSYDSLEPSERKRARLLSNQLATGLTDGLASEIDAFVFDTLDLGDVERDAIRDTLATALPSTDSKRKSVATPTKNERGRFIRTLSQSLNDVLSASHVHMKVRERSSSIVAPWRMLEITSEEGVAEPAIPLERFLEAADAGGASLVTVRVDAGTWFIGILDRYALWTPTRARILASDLIAARSRS